MTSNLAADEIAQYGLQLRREAEARSAQRVRPITTTANESKTGSYVEMICPTPHTNACIRLSKYTIS